MRQLKSPRSARPSLGHRRKNLGQAIPYRPPAMHRTEVPMSAMARWASTALDLPAKRPLYRLFASLGGFVLEATCFAQGPRLYAVAVTLDNVHVPGSPAGGFATL